MEITPSIQNKVGEVVFYFYFSVKTIGTALCCETVLIRGNNTFSGEILKNYPCYPSFLFPLNSVIFGEL